MLYLTHIPKPPLNEFVELFWFYDGFPARGHQKERLMPDGSVELVINLKEDETRVYDRETLDLSSSLPGTSVCGTGRSSMGHTGLPVTRSNTKIRPILVTCTI